MLWQKLSGNNFDPKPYLEVFDKAIAIALKSLPASGTSSTKPLALRSNNLTHIKCKATKYQCHVEYKMQIEAYQKFLYSKAQMQIMQTPILI